MKLIKILPPQRYKNNRLRLRAIFLCSGCNKKIERDYYKRKHYKLCIKCSNRIIAKNNIKHNETQYNSRLYRIWIGINKRCYNKKSTGYKYYGGKGIKVCNEWYDNYILFKKWALSNGYKNNLTIDRINNDKNYYPGNCRWITKKEQSRNQTSTKMNLKKVNQIRSLYFNVKITQKLLGKIFGLSKSHINGIINNKKWI